MPLWAGIPLPPGGSAAAVVDFVNALLHEGGIATSDVDSGLQWDGDNVWPPLQYFAAAALRSLDDPSATLLAVKVERTYVSPFPLCNFVTLWQVLEGSAAQLGDEWNAV